MTRNPSDKGPDDDKTAYRLSEILSGRGPSNEASLGGLLRRASLLAQLQNRLAGALHPDLAANMRVANVRDGRLVVLSPSPAWAARLRMQSRQLLDLVHDAGLTSIDRVEVRVVPPIDWPTL